MSKEINHRDESVLGKLSTQTRRILESLARSPVAEQALEQAEKADTEKRRAISQQLARLQKQTVDESLVRGVVSAREALFKAEEAVKAANAELATAVNKLDIAETSIARDKATAVRELISTADERFDEFIFKVDHIMSGQLPFKLQLWVQQERGLLDRLYSHGNNGEDWRAARDACERVISEACAAKLEPLNYAEVSQLLAGWCVSLATPLSKLELNPPTLTAAYAEVGHPLSWNGSPQWIVDEPYRITRNDGLKELSELAKTGRKA